MTGPYADLHIHSYYSDGTMAPAEILAAAQAAGVGLLAISDHNVLEGSRELRALCRGTGIRMIPAVELDCLHEGRNVHILAYGFDLDDANFVKFVRKNRALLDLVNSKLIDRMALSVTGVTPEDYAAFEYDRRLGGWKALHYFVHKGLAGSLKDGLRYYAQYGVSHDAVGFPSPAEVCRFVREAGGRPVLAHPGETFGSSEIGCFTSDILELVGLGVEGVECYYPTHSDAVTSACLAICDERGLLVTAGSDCHGGFGRMAVGETKTAVGKLRIIGLL